VPYCDVEFIFDRPEEAPDSVYLRGPSLLRIARDDTQIENLGSADRAMVKARQFSFKSTSSLDVKKDRVRTSTGMETFLAPQTLVNFSGNPRAIPILDRTRPLVSIESVTITVVPTVGLYSFKQATMNLKVHDRTRLNEFAEILQPYGTNRVSMWLTYGWRHPVEGDKNPNLETYGRFINDRMMVKECYNLKNATYSFDASGQVSIVCELYTKGLDELLSMTVGETEGFERIRIAKEKISRSVSAFMRRFRVSNLTLGQKEVRPLQILGAAANGTMPSFESTDIPKLIDELIKSLSNVKSDDGSTPSSDELSSLRADLNQYYSVVSGNNTQNTLNTDLSETVEAVIQKKFESLDSKPDPFILTQEKIDAKKNESTGYTVPDYWEALKAELSAPGEKRKVASFGKIFCTFMEPAINASPSFDEVQIYFYCLNDYAGKASQMNLADFPIDLNDFKLKYREFITKRASSVMTIREFLTLVSDAQIKNLAAIPYGFKTQKGLLKKDKNGNALGEIENPSQFEVTSLSWNKGRGAFQIPKVVAYSEMVHKENPSLKSFDKLSILDMTNSFMTSGTNKDKILRIHILDETANQHAPKITAIRDELSGYQIPNTNRINVDEAQKNAQAIKSARDANKPGERSYRVFESTVENTVVRSNLETINNRESLIRAVAHDLPILVPGQSTSGILEATMSSKADPTQKAAIMTGHKTGRELQGGPRGTDMGEFPIQVIPSDLQMKTIGCPLVSFAQSFFVDLNTGTTIDNMYNVSGITHTITPGKFETSLKMPAADSYAKYRGADDLLNEIIGVIGAAADAAKNN
jgi:hypothetical protein